MLAAGLLTTSARRGHVPGEELVEDGRKRTVMGHSEHPLELIPDFRPNGETFSCA